MKQIGYWAVGKSNSGRRDNQPGDLFVSMELYTAGGTGYYTDQGYTLIPAYISDGDYADWKEIADK